MTRTGNVAQNLSPEYEVKRDLLIYVRNMATAPEKSFTIINKHNLQMTDEQIIDALRSHQDDPIILDGGDIERVRFVKMRVPLLGESINSEEE